MAGKPSEGTASVIAIGNPGAGKSTMLNALAKANLFRSGVSYGSGYTEALAKKENSEGVFYDTPGLADDILRERAAEGIRDALREGGRYKLLFFVLTESGRVVKQDIATMKLVLEATPEVGNNYGIVINQLPERVAQGLQNKTNLKKFVTSLFYGMDEESVCGISNIISIMKMDVLDVQDDVLVSLDDIMDIEGNKFGDFVRETVPVVQLTKDKADDIKAHNFESTTLELNAMQKQLDTNKELYAKQEAWLVAQLKRAEQERDLERQMRQKDFDQMQARQDKLVDVMIKANESKNQQREERWHAAQQHNLDRERLNHEFRMKQLENEMTTEEKSKKKNKGFFSRVFRS